MRRMSYLVSMQNVNNFVRHANVMNTLSVAINRVIYFILFPRGGRAVQWCWINFQYLFGWGVVGWCDGPG